MRICISINCASILNENWSLFFNQTKMRIFESREVSLIHVDNPGEYEIRLTNDIKRNILRYILLWIGNLLIAPINILLLNSDSNWYDKITPTILWRCKCNFQDDSNVDIRITPSVLDDEPIGKYDISLISSANCVKDIVYQETFSRNSLYWEMNKYLSRFFSFELCAFAMLYFIFWYVSFNNWLLVSVIIGVIMAILFGTVTVYTCHKAKILESHSTNG